MRQLSKHIVSLLMETIIISISSVIMGKCLFSEINWIEAGVERGGGQNSG